MTSSRYATAKKEHARRDTIIDVYRSVFQRQALPPTKQYWSMCAQCVGADGQPLPGSELAQSITAGLIQPYQFHGVDRDEAVYASNRRYPEAHWYCDDFYTVLSLAADQEGFNPGVVNVDTVSEPRRGVDLFCRILERLDFCAGVLFVGNFILKNRGRQYTIEDVVKEMNRNTRFRYVGRRLNWLDTLYRYNGANYNQRTEMCSILLWKNEEAPNVKEIARGTSCFASGK